MSTPVRLPNRLIRLFLGLALFGVGIALMVRARLGLDAWNVLHEGVAERTGLPFGQVVIGTAVLVLLLWIPLRQRPGFGTIANVVVVGLVVDGVLWLLPAPENLPLRAALLAAAIVLTALATGLYIGAGLGPGPRDGLMTGWATRGHSIRLGRTVIEVTVLGTGVLLGGTVGVGTIVFTLAIGPLAHWFLPRLTPKPASKASRPRWTRNSSAPTDAASSPRSSGTAAPNSPRSPTCGSRTAG
ncbi:YitT family protein [Embleya sp. NPDC050154]|uniref:membrane protein YczE n=1 Tax=Embleya sp. NPDC050154 TaxID=3363988 RepID=UPI0037B29D29